MNLSKLPKILANQPSYRLKQIKKEVYANLVQDWKEASSLPLSLRKKLNKECPLAINARTFISKDKKTIKAVISLTDKLNIETVLMRQKERYTACVSTQVGCPLGCLFCATGKIGFKRNLTADEIIEQVIFFARRLKKSSEKVNRVVFMDMGEPLLNFDNSIKAIQILNDPEGFNLGQRKISLSTIGIPDLIKKFADLKTEVNLAISLHAPEDRLRQKLMPASKQYPLKEILKAVDYYLAKTNRKVMFEYLMINKVNDQVKWAEKIASLLKNRLCMVNLIAYNPTGDFEPSTRIQIERFKQVLQNQGIETTQRYSFGQDIKAACGQLAMEAKT
ncbi:23S rRNA (adenine(2503)-C(2))-methyltransferase RlmN [Candidatus Microgenomates bacterium]|nr:23S rRNA (adenine(2503)-C(2))-methyltransferase RlmN [Candidatus Microgenomates bacterium]